MMMCCVFVEAEEEGFRFFSSPVHLPTSSLLFITHYHHLQRQHGRKAMISNEWWPSPLNVGNPNVTASLSSSFVSYAWRESSLGKPRGS
jgi:hypothetical protein